MKNKFTSIITLSAGLIIGAQAQATPVMVAGWDFSPFAFDQFSSVDGTTLQGFLPANFTARPSDGLGLPNFTGAPAFGTLFYDGTNGSTAFDLNASGILPSGDGELGLLGGTGSIGASGNLNTLFAQGQQFANPKALGLTVNGSITYAIDMTTFPLGSVGEDWSLRFAHMYKPGPGDTSTSATIAWDYSLNGTDFVSTGETTVLTSAAVAAVVDLSSIGALDGVTQAYFRGNYTGIGTGVAYVDNAQVFAVAVPEPSVYAAILGVFGLGLVMLRRRRKA